MKWSVIILCVLLIGCKEKAPEKVEIDPYIKCFSGFMFGRDSDTLRHFSIRSFLFNKDTVLILKIDTLHNWTVERAILSFKEIDTINRMMQEINFKAYLHNTMLQDMRKSGMSYCLPRYGFVDNHENVEVFLPYGKETQMDNLVIFLNNRKSVKTDDTLEMIKHTVNIKRKYLKSCSPIPVMEEVKFVPPVIHDDKIEEK